MGDSVSAFRGTEEGLSALALTVFQGPSMQDDQYTMVVGILWVAGPWTLQGNAAKT